MNSMKISYLAHRYAPEMFKSVRVYGKPFELDYNTLRGLGYIFITKGHKACIAEIKRLYRAGQKKSRYCTIGFMLNGRKRKYCFTRDLAARDDSLPDKFRVYKAFKHFLSEQGCKYVRSETAERGAGFQVGHVTKRYEKVDLSRPVKIYFRHQ